MNKRNFLPLSFLALLFACALPSRATFISQVLGDSPVGFWILNDALGSPTTTAEDSTLNNFDGTYGAGVTPRGIEGPSWVSGSVANFNGGLTGNISFPATLDLGVNGYTIEAWINPTPASLDNPSRIVATSSTGFKGYGFGTTEGGQLVFTLFSVQDYETTLANLLPSQWYYVGVVLDEANNARFYVNGELVQTVAGPGGTAAPLANFSIGSRAQPTPDETFTGGIAGVSVYNMALSSGQIAAQYAAAVPEPASYGLVGVLFAFAALVVRRMAGHRSR